MHINISSLIEASFYFTINSAKGFYMTR